MCRPAPESGAGRPQTGAAQRSDVKQAARICPAAALMIKLSGAREPSSRSFLRCVRRPPRPPPRPRRTRAPSGRSRRQERRQTPRSRRRRNGAADENRTDVRHPAHVSADIRAEETVRRRFGVLEPGRCARRQDRKNPCRSAGSGPPAPAGAGEQVVRVHTQKRSSTGVFVPAGPLVGSRRPIQGRATPTAKAAGIFAPTGQSIHCKHGAARPDPVQVRIRIRIDSAPRAGWNRGPRDFGGEYFGRAYHDAGHSGQDGP